MTSFDDVILGLFRLFATVRGFRGLQWLMTLSLASGLFRDTRGMTTFLRACR